MLRLILSVQMILGMPFFMSNEASAQAAIDWNEKFRHQVAIKYALDRIVPKLLSAKTFADIERLLPEDTSDRDRAFLKKQFRTGMTLPKFERLNRGIAYAINGRRHFIVIDNIPLQRLKFDDKVTFTYNKNNSLEVQVEALGRAAKKAEISFMDILFPRAEAAIDGASIAVGILVGAIVMPLAAAGYNFISKNVQEWYCADKAPSTGYFVNWMCSDYFEWKVKTQTKTVPFAAAATAIRSAADQMNVNRKCQSKQDPDIVSETTAQDGTFTRTRIKFDPARKPVQITFEVRKKGGDMGILICDLNDDNTLKVAKTGRGEVKATSDKTVTSTMSPTQLTQNAEEVAKVNELIKPVISMIDACNDMIAQALKSAADQPASLIADDVKIGPAAIVPVVPSSGSVTIIK